MSVNHAAAFGGTKVAKTGNEAPGANLPFLTHLIPATERDIGVELDLIDELEFFDDGLLVPEDFLARGEEGGPVGVLAEGEGVEGGRTSL